MRGAGKLRHSIWVRTWSKSKNAEMEVVESYSAGTEVPCHIRFLKGSERVESNREGNEIDLEIRMRYEDDLVSEKDLLEFRETSPYETYDPVAIYPDDHRRELIIQAKMHK